MNHPTVMLAALLAFMPVVASTQSLEEVPRELLGKTVFLTDETGRQRKGRVTDMSVSSLVLSGPDRQTFQLEAIREIRRSDSLWNGLLIGLAAGVVPGAFVGQVSCGEGPSGACATGAVKGALVFGGLGALVGVFIDEALERPGRVVYSASPAVRVAPFVAPRLQGVMLSVEF